MTIKKSQTIKQIIIQDSCFRKGMIFKVFLDIQITIQGTVDPTKQMLMLNKYIKHTYTDRRLYGVC